ncbi:MAG: hypothetical protein MUC38_02565 [Cyclobacteriaceae bacterium]|jgi:hypothetical protein|nr:hypothetical protein [Cyclobacteriaceae bacterium]
MIDEREIARICQARLPHSDMLNILDVLGYGPDRFQDAFDIALEMENRDLVKLLYAHFNSGKIVVEFTLLGKDLGR